MDARSEKKQPTVLPSYKNNPVKEVTDNWYSTTVQAVEEATHNNYDMNNTYHTEKERASQVV